MQTWFSNYNHRDTLDQLAVMNFSEVFVLHILELIHETQIATHSFVVFNEVFFEIHHIFIGSLFGAVDVDRAEVLIILGLYEGQTGRIALLLR